MSNKKIKIGDKVRLKTPLFCDCILCEEFRKYGGTIERTHMANSFVRIGKTGSIAEYRNEHLELDKTYETQINKRYNI